MLSVKKQKLLNLSYNEAVKSDLLYQHGCIATHSGKIVAKGFNKKNSCYNQACTCHAEIDVLQKMSKLFIKNGKYHKKNKFFRRTTLYISRYKDSVDCSNSAPCIDCLNAIKILNIKRLVFFQDNDCHIVNPNNYYTNHVSYGKLYINRINKSL